MSLSEFHAATATAQGGSNESSSIVRINWADEMEKLDDGQTAPAADYVFDRSTLPTATKSLLQQDINLELVPKVAPFTAYLSNISFEADDDKIRAFFKDLKVETVRLPTENGRFKGYGYVDFSDRESLIAALGKNEQMLNNRQLKISLERSRGEREAGGRGGYNNHQQDGPQKSDESDWRRREPVAEEEDKPASSGYQSYQNQGQNRYNRGGDRDQQNSSGGYQQRGNYQRGGGSGGSGGNAWQVAGGRGGGAEQDSNRRPYNNYQNRNYGERDQNRGGYGGDRENRGYGDRDQNRGAYGGDRDQNRGYGGDREQTRRPYRTSDQGQKEEQPNQADNQAGEGGRVERPKVVLAPRTVPVEEAGANVVQSSIFGGAKPVNTAAREREIEERLKEKEKERAEKERLSTSESNPPGTENAEEEAQQTTTSGTERSHKVSTTSVDSQGQEYRSPPQQQNRDQYNKTRQYNNNNNNRNRGGLQQSGSFTSPPHHQQQNPSYQQRSHEKPKDFVEAPRPSENAWKTKPASNLFSGAESEQNSGESNEERGANAPVRHQGPRQPGDDGNRRPYNPNNRRVGGGDSAGGQTRPHMNRGDNKDFKDKRGGGPPNADRNKQFGRNQRGDRQFNNSTRGGPGNEARVPRQHHQQPDEISDINVGNKFSGLKIDVEEDDNM